MDNENSRPSSSASTKQILHYSQLCEGGAFRQYDYGNDADNTAHYGSKIVPLIHLNEIPSTIPIALLVGLQDPLADQADVKWLRSQLGRRVKMYKAYD